MPIWARPRRCRDRQPKANSNGRGRINTKKAKRSSARRRNSDSSQRNIDRLAGSPERLIERSGNCSNIS
jgi:hypothetical protein